MIRRPIKSSTAAFLGVLSVLLLLGGYTFLAHRQYQRNPDDTTIPRWSQLHKGLQSAIEVNRRSEDRWLVVDAVASGQRLFLGLAGGVAASLLLGLAMGCFTPIEAFLHPPLSLLAKVPPTAALAVFFVLVGTGNNMYVAMIAFGVLPTMTLTVNLAVKEFPDELLYKAYTLGASHMEVVWTIIFRQVLPRFIDAFRLSIGPAMVYLIAAEMVVGDVGFGYRIRLQSKLLNMSVVYPYLAILAAFGFGMDSLLRLLQRKLCPWYEPRR
ncbi:MAG TPA: ABC transporter permease subunit [Candidatus Paceibacterota bacterium]|nr:ABC transporter permease subunit [Candidatus Paceibacterota bacterium]HRZ58893.1 ABC transporter permease subunit [Candidatus Paceibacterota bacterium]